MHPAASFESFAKVLYHRYSVLVLQQHVTSEFSSLEVSIFNIHLELKLVNIFDAELAMDA